VASISSTSGSQAAFEYGYQQIKLQQAQRTANQAEQNARALAAQANEAKRTADRAQEGARTLEVQSDKADTAAGQARQGLAALKTQSTYQSSLETTLNSVIATQSASAAAAVATTTSTTASTTPPPASVSAPVVNTQGEITGTIVNTTA
jgi:hypothetical protein